MGQDTQRTNELLESVLSGHQVEPDELDDLLRSQVHEDLHLEYKHGSLLLDRKEAAREVRRYVSGFANGVGGILLVGIDEDNWCITGAQAPGGGSLVRWASSCLPPIAGYPQPPPILGETAHTDVNVRPLHRD